MRTVCYTGSLILFDLLSHQRDPNQPEDVSEALQQVPPSDSQSQASSASTRDSTPTPDVCTQTYSFI